MEGEQVANATNATPETTVNAPIPANTAQVEKAQQTTANAQVGEKQAEPAKPAAKVEPSEELKQWQREVLAKKDQEIIRLTRELETAKSSGVSSEELTAIRLEIAELKDAQALNLARESGEEAKPVYKEQVIASNVARVQNATLARIQSALNQAGYTENDPAFGIAHELWQEGIEKKDPRFFQMAERNIRQALSMLPPKANANPVTSQPPDIEALIQKRAEELVAQKIKASQQQIDPSLLKIESGQASNSVVGNLSDAKLREAFTNNPYDPVIRARYFEWKAKQR